MPKPLFIARQSAHPRGWFGHLVARVMARETAPANRRVLEHLGPRSGERILEVGCGHGRTLAQVVVATAPARAAGVDPSEVMRRVARAHLRREIARGQVEIRDGEAADLPFEDGTFDKAFSTHTLYFWPDLCAGLLELRRVLRDGGELLLAFHDGADVAKVRQLPDAVYTLHPAADVEAALRHAGFRSAACTIDPDTGLAFASARR
jgi:ubiquinone/menaquinone biosynthesis C-methylase UbiE